MEISPTSRLLHVRLEPMGCIHRVTMTNIHTAGVRTITIAEPWPACSTRIAALLDYTSLLYGRHLGCPSYHTSDIWDAIQGVGWHAASVMIPADFDVALRTPRLAPAVLHVPVFFTPFSLSVPNLVP